jgi:hypothetical protein
MDGRWFANFGAGLATRLHGSEVVLSPRQAVLLSHDAGQIRLNDDVKRAIEEAVRRALRRRRGRGDV